MHQRALENHMSEISFGLQYKLALVHDEHIPQGKLWLGIDFFAFTWFDSRF